MRNYYEILDIYALRVKVTCKDIQQAFKKAKEEWAKLPDGLEKKLRYKEIVEAYDTLANPVRRKQHDADLLKQEEANSYNQTDILNVLKEYMRQQKRDNEFINLLDRGHCNGFASLWLYCKWLSFQPEIPNKPRDDTKWFYDTMKFIAKWDQKSEFSFYERLQIERFLSLLHLCQKNEFVFPCQQGELQNVLEDTKGRKVTKEYTIAALINQLKLAELLQDVMKEEKMVLLVSHNHAVAAILKNGIYYFYDSNRFRGEETKSSAADVSARFFNANSFDHDKASPVGVRVFGIEAPAPGVYPEQKQLLDKLYAGNVVLQCVSGYANNVTALESAAFIGCVESTKYHLDHGADPNIGTSLASKQGHTPLHHATDGGHVELAKVLIEKKANIDATNNKGLTPLGLAASTGRVEMVDLLLSRGADLSKTDTEGMLPADLAAKNKFIEIMQLFEQKQIALENKQGRRDRIAERNRMFSQLSYASYTNIHIQVLRPMNK